MSGFKERFGTYRTKTFVEREVQGMQIRFYPNRVALLEELAIVSKPIAEAISILFSDTRGDATAVTERFREGKDVEVEKITVQSVDPSTMAYRAKERSQALDTLISGLTNARTRLLFGKLLMDSMRDEFPWKKDRGVDEVEEFLYGDGKDYQGIDLPVLTEMVKGWMAANAKVFGSAGEQAVGLVRARLQSLRAESSPVPETTSPTNGSDSKTPSSTPLATAST